MVDIATRSGTVSSADGTTIAYSVVGSGPAVVFVDGALCYREFGPDKDIAAQLAPHFAVYTFDRRGRGESGNTLPYDAAREIEDVAAMIEAAGGSAMLVGVSSGGGLALLASAAGLPVSKLAIYEVPYMVSAASTAPADMQATLDRLIGADDRAGALRFFMVDMVGAPAFSMLFMKAIRKVWRSLLATAPTLPYDARVMGDFTPDVASFSHIGVPALVMRGGKAAQWMTDAAELLAKTLPHSTYEVLAKQTHQVKADVIGPRLVAFLGAS
ncbi:MAG TPA: alpha/beta hydrolase [Galbitalea sp.]|jgi:pimeloyl-ACP methyl ester carboxylesterase